MDYVILILSILLCVSVVSVVFKTKLGKEILVLIINTETGILEYALKIFRVFYS